MKIKLFILFSLLLFILLFVFLPVKHLVGFLPSDSHIEIASAEGKIWKGEALQVKYQDKLIAEKLIWAIDWSALADMQLRIDLDFNNPAGGLKGQGSVSLGWSGWSVDDLSVKANVLKMSYYFNILSAISMQGKAALEIKHASLGDPYCQQVNGYIDWDYGLLGTSLGNVDLGSSHADLDCESGNLVAVIKQTSSDLTSKTKVVFEKNRIFRVKGKLKRGALPASFNRILRLLGPENSAGEKSFNFSSRLY